jgi:DNA-binding transcriptional regulator YiaG
MRKKTTAGERILGSMKQITKWAEGDESAARLTTIPSIDVRKIRRRLKMTQR